MRYQGCPWVGLVGVLCAAWAVDASAQSPDFSRVVSLGDSLTAPAPWPTYPALITPLLGSSSFANLAVGGTTSTTLLSTGQHTRAINDHQATFAFLWIGGNDMLGAWYSGALSQPGNTAWIDLYEANLATALDTLSSGGADVIIANLMDFNDETGFPRGNSVPPRQRAIVDANLEVYRVRLQSVADARGVPVVSLFAAWSQVLANPPVVEGVPVTHTLTAGQRRRNRGDDIHPNGLGQRIIANFFIDKMNQEWGLSLPSVALPDPGTLGLLAAGSAAGLLRVQKRRSGGFACRLRPLVR